jgi:hypothetical protein
MILMILQGFESQAIGGAILNLLWGKKYQEPGRIGNFWAERIQPCLVK